MRLAGDVRGYGEPAADAVPPRLLKDVALSRPQPEQAGYLIPRKADAGHEARPKDWIIEEEPRLGEALRPFRRIVVEADHCPRALAQVDMMEKCEVPEAEVTCAGFEDLGEIGLAFKVLRLLSKLSCEIKANTH